MEHPTRAPSLRTAGLIEGKDFPEGLWMQWSAKVCVRSSYNLHADISRNVAGGCWASEISKTKVLRVLLRFHRIAENPCTELFSGRGTVPRFPQQHDVAAGRCGGWFNGRVINQTMRGLFASVSDA
jgi:hypothetical protein